MLLGAPIACQSASATNDTLALALRNAGLARPVFSVASPPLRVKAGKLNPGFFQLGDSKAGC